MKNKNMILFIILISLLLPIIHSEAASNEAFQIYQEVISGQKEFEELTPEQQRQVIEIHKLLNRSNCEGCSEECCDAKEEAESYRDDLESYIKRFHRCVNNNDLSDDCYSEYRRVKSAYSDFESAISDVNSYCD